MGEVFQLKSLKWVEVLNVCSILQCHASKCLERLQRKTAPHQTAFLPIDCILDSIWQQFTSALNVFITALPQKVIFTSHWISHRVEKTYFKQGGNSTLDYTICFQSCFTGSTIEKSQYGVKNHNTLWLLNYRLSDMCSIYRVHTMNEREGPYFGKVPYEPYQFCIHIIIFNTSIDLQID